MVSQLFGTRLAVLAGLSLAASPAVPAERAVVEIFAAGSLRGVVADLAATVGTALGIDIHPSFGGSGSLRERIEHGEPADLLLSADLGSPRKLEQAGRTRLPVTAIARNRLCVVSRRTLGVTPANLVERLLADGTRVRTSTPVADPAGDYAWWLFERIEQAHPGDGEALKAKASASMTLVATPTSPAQSAAAALFASRQIDMSITYCSASAELVRELPELASLPVTGELDPHPVYGMALLTDKPAALQVALYLLSEKGQAIVARNGLLPVLETTTGER